MAKRLVFLHGRAQQNKDALALKREWIASFEDGLERIGKKLPMEASEIRFPYYGDTLYQLSRGDDPASAAPVVVKGTESPAKREFMEALLKEMQIKARISDSQLVQEVTEKGILNWGPIQSLLQFFDRYVPFGSGASIALFTSDVFDYLTNKGVQRTIDTGVLAAIASGEETVVVSHSLGTVVAYRILAQQGKALGWKVPTFVTLGSPLAVSRIKQSLAPLGRPDCVTSWFNAFDERDVVALYPLAPPDFDITPDKIENYSKVRNQTENRHGISGYLNDPEVAQYIFNAVS